MSAGLALDLGPDEDSDAVLTEDEDTYISDYSDTEAVHFTYGDAEEDIELRPYRYVPPLDYQEKVDAYDLMFTQVLYEVRALFSMTMPADRFSITLHNTRVSLGEQSFYWKNVKHIYHCYHSLPLKVRYETRELAELMFQRIEGEAPKPGEPPYLGDLLLSYVKFFRGFVDVIESELSMSIYQLTNIFYDRVVNPSAYDPGKKSNMLAYGVSRYESNHQLFRQELNATVMMDPRARFNVNDRVIDFITQFSKRDSMHEQSKQRFQRDQIPFVQLMSNMWNDFMGKKHSNMIENHTQFFIAVFTMLNNRIEFERSYV